MRARSTLAVLALLASPALVACGGSSEEEPSSSESSSASESASESPSEAASESPSESADAPAAGSPEAYAGLLEALLTNEKAVQEGDTPEEVNAAADYPEGVELTRIDKSEQSLCVQDNNQDISLTFSASDAAVVMFEGLCDEGEEVARIEPGKDPNQLEGSGDQAIADAAEKVFRDNLG